MRLAVRSLLRNPGFAAIAIATLALGVGATTAIFSVVYGVLLKPLPYAEPARLVMVHTSAPRHGLPRAFVGAANYRDWRDQNHVFTGIAMFRNIGNFNLTGSGEPERIQGAYFTANLLDVLGVQPMMGRGFREEENQIGRDNVVLLSYGLWHRRFGGDPHVLGRTIHLNAVPHTVVGVMLRNFRFPSREFELYKPVTVNPDDYRTRLANLYLTVARMKPDVALEQAQAEMKTISARLERQYPANKGIGAVVTPLLEEQTGAVRTPLYVLLGAVGGLLLIGCSNLANLLLARATARTRELTVRMALGAGRARLIWHLLAESAPILALGGLFGVLMAAWGVDALIPLLPSNLPRLDDIEVNTPVLMGSLLVALATGLLFSLLPAIQVTRGDLVGGLKEDARGGAALRHSRTRDLLAVFEVALALLLLTGAGLLLRSFSRLSAVNPGFRTNGALTMHLAIPRSKHDTDHKVASLCARVLERVRTLPGVEAAGMINRLPLVGSGSIQTGPVQFEGAQIPTIASVDYRTATPDYFRAIGIPLLRGRLLTERDTAEAPLVAVIDEHMARLAFPGDGAVGKRLRMGFAGMNLPWYTVIGVVGHIRHDSLESEQRPQVYWNYWQRAQDRMAMVVRTAGDPYALAPAVVAAVREADPEQPVYDVRAIGDVVARSVAQRWLNTLLMAVFSGVALLLASVGVYGVIAYSTARRVREFGIRVALGARGGHIFALVLRHGLAIALAGAATGMAGAAAMTRVLGALLYEVSPTDSVTFAAAPLVLLGAALAACWIPARRAMRVEPTVALRSE